MEVSLSLDMKGSNTKIFTTKEAWKCSLRMGVGSVAGELRLHDSK